MNRTALVLFDQHAEMRPLWLSGIDAETIIPDDRTRMTAMMVTRGRRRHTRDVDDRSIEVFEVMAAAPCGRPGPPARARSARI
jgi:hypothetical protein